eukprot:SAG31_NODE_44523_length_262_cov_0.950920_1_plen_23_part_10
MAGALARNSIFCPGTSIAAATMQ